MAQSRRDFLKNAGVVVAAAAGRGAGVRAQSASAVRTVQTPVLDVG